MICLYTRKGRILSDLENGWSRSVVPRRIKHDEYAELLDHLFYRIMEGMPSTSESIQVYLCQTCFNGPRPGVLFDYPSAPIPACTNDDHRVGILLLHYTLQYHPTYFSTTARKYIEDAMQHDVVLQQWASVGEKKWNIYAELINAANPTVRSPQSLVIENVYGSNVLDLFGPLKSFLATLHPDYTPVMPLEV